MDLARTDSEVTCNCHQMMGEEVRSGGPAEPAMIIVVVDDIDNFLRAIQNKSDSKENFNVTVSTSSSS